MVLERASSRLDELGVLDESTGLAKVFSWLGNFET
jgi:hypothetical protein